MFYDIQDSPFREPLSMRRKVPVLTWAVVLAFPPAMALLSPLPPSARAQDALEELYGQGVHLYNAGDYRAAYYELTRAVDNGSEDPRVYYYRGLCYLKLGRDQEGKSDFAKAASMEMSDSDRFYPVSKSLERVQGRARQMIERYRSNARLRAFQKRERNRYERYERIRRNEPNVLLSPAPGESTKLPAPGGEKPAPDADDEPMPAESDEPPPETDDAFAPADDKADAEMPAEGAETEAPDAEMPADAEAPDADQPDAEADDSAATTKVPAKQLGKSVGGALLRALAKQKSPTGAAPANIVPPGPPLPEKAPAAPPPDDDPFK